MGGDATRAAIPFFMLTVVIEAVAVHRNRNRVDIGEPTDDSNVDAPIGYEPRDTGASLAMGVGSLVVNAASYKVLGPLDRRVFGRRLLNLGARRSGFVAALLIWDFLYYWDHRWSHERRVLWASHVNHHSSERYNLSTALRQSWSSPIVHWVFMPMLVLGFSPALVARAGQWNLLYQYWVHTETIDRLPLGLESLMNSASHHRVHHGSNPQYLDRNYGGIFIVWDRLFGTFEPEGERVRYGLTKNIDTFNPVKVAYHEFAALFRDLTGARSWSERRNFLLGPPGWTPESAPAESEPAGNYEDVDTGSSVAHA